jgi:Tfp pilus assembly protein PilO
MSNVPDLRRRFQILIIALLVVDVAAAAALLTPLAGSRERREAGYTQVHNLFQQKERDAIPLRNINQKLAQASQQITSFYDQRFPARASDVADELTKVAQANNVRFTNIRYKTEETDIPGLYRVDVDASLAGDYVRIVKFINGLERARMFFIVDSVNLAEQQSGGVRLEMKLETYLRRT